MALGVAKNLHFKNKMGLEDLSTMVLPKPASEVRAAYLQQLGSKVGADKRPKQKRPLLRALSKEWRQGC